MSSEIISFVKLYPFTLFIFFNVCRFCRKLLEKKQVMQFDISLQPIYNTLLIRYIIILNLPWVFMSYALITNSISHITLFLRPQDKNLYVIVFSVLLIFTRFFRSKVIMGINIKTMRKQMTQKYLLLRLAKEIVFVVLLGYIVYLDFPTNKTIHEYSHFVSQSTINKTIKFLKKFE